MQPVFCGTTGILLAAYALRPIHTALFAGFRGIGDNSGDTLSSPLPKIATTRKISVRTSVMTETSRREIQAIRLSPSGLRNENAPKTYTQLSKGQPW